MARCTILALAALAIAPWTAAGQSFTVSGRVTAGISSLPGVTLSGLPGDPVTDATGNYTATVPSGFSGTVTPTKAGYAFTPASRTYTNVTSNQTGQNYSGSTQTVTISGRVTVSISSLPGVTLSGLPGDPVTDATGNYTATVPSGFSGTVTPTKAGYAFTPASRTYTNVTSNQTGQNYSGTAAACPTWYHDADGDTYGNVADSVVSCTEPSGGYVSDSADCDDQDAAIHPGAVEVCGNGIDDDCVGDDEPCGDTWYRDADGDQYGDPADSITSMSKPAGYVSEQTDCDDSRSDVHPGVAEACEDSVDNNCDGQVDENCDGSPPSSNDTDQDGVADETDACPGTAAEAVVDAEGCAAEQRDSDDDGVIDDLDQCPGTVPGTVVSDEGCALPTSIENTGSAAPCGAGATAGIAGITAGLSFMQRRRPRRA